MQNSDTPKVSLLVPICNVERYLRDIESGKSFPLLTVTSGYHFHRIAAEDEQTLDEIEAMLKEKGYLADLMPYEDDLS